MEVGVTVSFEEQEGTHKLSVLESGCYVQDISINMNGGASWLYQGYPILFSSVFFSYSYCIVVLVLV